MIINTPKPPYYAVIFTSILQDNSEGYEEEAQTIFSLAQVQPGFLGMETARNELGISVSYWKSVESIQKWSQNARHSLAKKKGKAEFYKAFRTRISKVEREY